MTERIIPIVKEAAKIYKAAGNDLKIEIKTSKNDLVTAYDKRIQDFLVEKLSAEFKGCSFLGEEDGCKKTVSGGLCFIIDPIDGTTNFIKGFEHSAISVGLAQDGNIISGVVYDVDKGNLYYADKGKGAYLNGKKISVSDNNLETSVMMFGTSPYNRELASKTFAITQEVFYEALEIRRSGSAALDVCYVASGKADLYFEMNIKVWDWAAASIILTEAGGKLLTLDKEPISTSNVVSSIFATNQKNDKRFFELMDKALGK